MNRQCYLHNHKVADIRLQSAIGMIGVEDDVTIRDLNNNFQSDFQYNNDNDDDLSNADAFINDNDFLDNLANEFDQYVFKKKSKAKNTDILPLPNHKLGKEVTLADLVHSDPRNLANVLYQKEQVSDALVGVKPNWKTDCLTKLKLIRKLFYLINITRESEFVSFRKCEVVYFRLQETRRLGGVRDFNVVWDPEYRGNLYDDEEETPYNDSYERFAITTLVFRIMGISMDKNGFAIMPDWVRDAVSPTGSKSVRLPANIVESALPTATPEAMGQMIEKLKDLPASAKGCESVATFVHLYNFEVLKKFLIEAETRQDSEFINSLIEFCESLHSNLKWEDLCFAIEKLHQDPHRHLVDNVLDLTYEDWNNFIDQCSYAIETTRSRNRYMSTIGLGHSVKKALARQIRN